jgi:hypothetical protein
VRASNATPGRWLNAGAQSRRYESSATGGSGGPSTPLTRVFLAGLAFDFCVRYSAEIPVRHVGFAPVFRHILKRCRNAGRALCEAGICSQSTRSAQGETPHLAKLGHKSGL